MNENRLLFGKCSDSDVIERAKGSHRRWFGMIEATARQYASWGPTPKIGNRRVLGRDTLWHRHLGEGTAIFALGFRATESQWYLKQALRFLDKIASLTDWGGDLEQGHLLTGLALFTDWLWDDIDEPAQARACELLGLLAEGVMHQHKTGEGVGWWHRLYTQNHLWVN